MMSGPFLENASHLFGTGSRVFDVHAAGSGGFGELTKSKNTICSHLIRPKVSFLIYGW